MVDDVKSLWADLPALAKTGAFVGALLLTLFGGVAIGDGTTPMAQEARRLDALEKNDARQDTVLADLQRGQPKTDYLFCVDLSDRHLIPQSPQDCFQTYADR